MFPKTYEFHLNPLRDYERAFLPVGFFAEDSILVAVPPSGLRFGFHIVGPGDDHERIAGHILKSVRYKLEKALTALGVSYRLVVADVEGGETLGDWLRMVVGEVQKH